MFSIVFDVVLLFVGVCYCELVYRTPGFPRSYVPDTEKLTPDFIEGNGYITETHDVTTEDGYILELHRIVPKNGRSENVILLQHGISSSSDNWVLTGPNAFPFQLSDRGYDVWIANSRGNRYGLRHVSLTTNDTDFWLFSFHEQGYYDLAATVDYTLTATGQSDLILIAHSRGTTSSFVLLSLRSEYNKKIRLLLCFAPVAYLKNAKNPYLQAIFKHTSYRFSKKLLDRSNIYSTPGLTKAMLNLRKMYCRRDSTFFELCIQLVYIFNGHDYFVDRNMTQVIATHFPGGSSVLELLHWIQVARTDTFAMFDHGIAMNMKLYRSQLPPVYPVRKIQVPIALFYSEHDNFVSIKDLRKLMDTLTAPLFTYKVPNPLFSHLDFLWAYNAKEQVYKTAYRLLQNYSNPKTIPNYRQSQHTFTNLFANLHIGANSRGVQLG